MHIQPHLSARNYGGEGRPPRCPFENQKTSPDFGKKGPDLVHLSVKFSIQNIVLRVSRRKNSKMYPCRTLFPCVFDKTFEHVLNTYKSYIDTLLRTLFTHIETLLRHIQVYSCI